MAAVTQTPGPLVEIDPQQIRRLLDQEAALAGKLPELGAQLGLSGEELSQIKSGKSGLRLTPQQYETLQARAAAAYEQAASQAGGETDQLRQGQGGACGCGAPKPSVAPETGTKSPVTETKAGTELHSGTVGGGTVTLRAGVEANVGTQALTELFAIQYKGKDSQNAHWLQFIWREVVGEKSSVATPILGTITTTGGTYDLTDGGTLTAFGTPVKKNYNTDTASATDPFYEAAGAANRTADATTIYDLPSNMKNKVNDAFDAGAEKVVSRAHFTTFLIQNDVVTYKVEINVQWDFAAKTDNPTRKQTAGECGATSKLPDTIRARFHEQFPSYNFIQ